MSTPFRLIWFTSVTPRNWELLDSESYDWRGWDMYRDMAQLLEERGRLDALVFADTSAIPTNYGGNTDAYLKHGVEMVSHHDPIPLFGAMAAVTRQIGLVSTLSTSLYPPELLAQVTATIDHLSAGRAAWNIVTSTGTNMAQNFGLDRFPSGDIRYDMAETYVEQVRELYRTARDTLDPEFEGLRMPPPPQGQPVFMQAGGSDRGRDFAARHAEIVIMHRNSVPAMKDFRDDMRARMVKIGRDPDTCKIFFTVKVVAGRTDAEAKAIYQQQLNSPTINLESGLANFSHRIGFDVSKLPLDEPLPENLGGSIIGSQGVLQQHTEKAQPTLRQIGMAEAAKESYVAIGTPAAIASQLEAAMDEIGGDGFALRHTLHPSIVLPIIETVVPELRARGLVRSDYRFKTLRENLLDPDFVTAAPSESAAQTAERLVEA